VTKKIRGVTFEENLKNSMGLEFYNLSHRFGYQSPNWPYFEDVKIERIHYHAKSGVLSQRITTSMHNTTHIDAPAHVVQGTPFIDEVPLPHFFGSGIVVSIPKKKWEQITYEDLEKAAGKVVRPRDVVIVNTGWHKLYEDNEDYFCRAPGFVSSAGEWFVEKQVKVVGHDTQANDHPLATAIGPQRNGPLHPHLADEYKKWSGGRDRQALHLRVFPVELGSWRRLHHSARRHHRPQGRLPDREGGEVLMQVKHLSEAKAYEAPNHRAYCSLRLFGLDAGGPKQFTVGLSHFLPGGGAGPDASPTEKVYYVLSGELTLIVDGKETVLKANDSCFIGPNESREIINRGNGVVTMLVAVSTPQK
jgi:kynurenine formamidase/quercetin dioxygenase-like cupin family protein